MQSLIRVSLFVWPLRCWGKRLKIYLDSIILLGKQGERFKLAGTNVETLRIGCTKNRSKYTRDGAMIDEATLWRRPLSLGEIKMVIAGDIMAVVFPKEMPAVARDAIKTSLRS